MYGELLKSTSRLAIIAAAGVLAGGLTFTSAQAADLGGDCCADLEERVADLEATTARKGNRKVSLKISGNVTRNIGWIEDHNGDSEFYSAGSGVAGSRIQFSGSAKLTSNITAGYKIRLRLNGDRDSDALTDAGRSGDSTLGLDRNVVSLTHSQLGAIELGLTPLPTDGTMVSLSGRDATGGAGSGDWNGIVEGFNLTEGSQDAIVFYSPEMAGFSFGIGWGDQSDAAVGSQGVDTIDMALYFAQEFGPIQFAAAIGYNTVDHETDNAGDDVDGANVMGSAAIKHVPTGLNVAFATGKEIDGGLNSGPTDTHDNTFWHVEGGVDNNFFGIGSTSIYGEYGVYDDGTADDLVQWGLGVEQAFDSAASRIYIAYRKWEDTDALADGDVSQIMGGMKISF